MTSHIRRAAIAAALACAVLVPSFALARGGGHSGGGHFGFAGTHHAAFATSGFRSGRLNGRRVDAPLASVGASVLRWLTGRDSAELPGDPFVT